MGRMAARGILAPQRGLWVIRSPKQARLEDAGLRDPKPARGPPLPAVNRVHDAI